MNPMDEPRRAIEAALRAGSALLKTVSPNDTGQTGSHQAGFLLPRSHWRFFSPYPRRNHLQVVAVAGIYQGSKVSFRPIPDHPGRSPGRKGGGG